MNFAINALKQIFHSHEALMRIDKSTYEFGFQWNTKDGIILYPQNTISHYLYGLMEVLFPETKTVVLSNTIGGEKITQLASEMPNALVVLCEMQSDLNHSLSLDYAELVQVLPRCWASRIITARQVGEFLPVGTRKTRIFDWFRKTDLPAAPGQQKRVENAYQLFEDTLSQITFLSILKRYLLRSDTLIPTSSGKLYFEDVYVPLKDEVFIDCGGYIGDTLLDYYKMTEGDFKEYHIFEPDPTSFRNLEKNITQLPNAIAAKVRTYPKALGHQPSMISFNAMGAYESHVDHNGGVDVEVVTLDHTLKKTKPTFMKLDLEGYEAFALLGARELIKNARPVISLCVYHHPFDLWELPLLVSSFVGGYRFFLRAYHESFDYVCYCVPEERLNLKM